MNNQTQSATRTPPATARRQLRRLIVYGNPEKAGVEQALAKLLPWCQRNGARLIVSSDIEHYLKGNPHATGDAYETYTVEGNHEGLFNGHDDALLVTLGGDGTLIHAIRNFWPIQVPVMGVNLGQLGFNASVEPAQMISTIEAWQEGRAQSSLRMMIHVQWVREGRVHGESGAMNDVVLAKKSDSRLIHLTLRQQNEVISCFAADGLIVASPTGATAYNLTAGGPIVHPAMQALIATGICPHTLAHRPVILPPYPPLTLQFEPRQQCTQAMLWIDGQESWPIEKDDSVILQAQKQALELVTCPNTAYYAMLRRKLHWGGELECPPLGDPIENLE